MDEFDWLKGKLDDNLQKIRDLLTAADLTIAEREEYWQGFIKKFFGYLTLLTYMGVEKAEQQKMLAMLNSNNILEKTELLSGILNKENFNALSPFLMEYIQKEEDRIREVVSAK